MSGLGLMNRRRAIASSPTAGKGVEALLLHLLFRWSIKDQDATNESLAANPTLVDLTGNGFNLPLSNFTFDGTTNGIMTDAEGEKFLRFSASPACNATKTFSSLGIAMADVQDYTIIAKRKWNSEGNYERLLEVFGGNANFRILAFELNDSKSKKYSRSRGGSGVESSYITEVYNPEKSVVYQVTDSYNGQIALSYDYSQNYGNINSVRIGNTANKGSFDIYDIMLFDIKLTEKEIEQVKKYFQL